MQKDDQESQKRNPSEPEKEQARLIWERLTN